MSDKNSQLIAALIAERKLSTETIGRVMRLYSSGKDVISYLRKDFSDAQLQEILTGLEEECDVSFYDNIKLSPAQMKAIREGVSRLNGHQSQKPTVEDNSPINEQLKEDIKVSEKTVEDEDEDKNESSKTDISEQARHDNKDENKGSSVASIVGKVIGFSIVALIVLLPRLCSKNTEKKTWEWVHDLSERGLVVKDGSIKHEPKVTTVYSGDLSLEHTEGWEATTGNADGYGYSIDLSHNSTYVAAIQVAALNNPHHASLSDAVNLSRNQISSMFEGIKATTEDVRDYDLNGTPAKVFNYKFDATGEESMNRRCITSVIGNYVLLIDEAFENYNDKDFAYIFSSIERSIRIKSGTSRTTQDNERPKPSSQVRTPRPSSGNMTISHEEATVTVGKTITLKAYNYGSRLRWESDDPEIATVSQSGVVRGKSQGSVLIWAIGDEENYLCCDVIVEASSKNMTISHEEATVSVGKTITLKAYNYGSRLRWESDDPEIATVSQSGVVRGKSQGSVLIWAIGDEENYLCCDVTVE